MRSTWHFRTPLYCRYSARRTSSSLRPQLATPGLITLRQIRLLIRTPFVTIASSTTVSFSMRRLQAARVSVPRFFTPRSTQACRTIPPVISRLPLGRPIGSEGGDVMLTTRRQIFTAALLVASAPYGTISAQEVGKASAVNPAATANLRTISIGSSIAHKERIRTTTAGSVQLLFLDKTSMTIGPNSDLTIDEYVYDPNAGTGKLAATLSKGALRFVGG